MPGPALRLLLLVLSLTVALPTWEPHPAEPEPEPSAAADLVKEDVTKPMMAKTTSPGRPWLESSAQEGLQKDHRMYKSLWEKEEFVVLTNGRIFDLESKMRASTYKNKKLLFQNIVLKLPSFRGKQANSGIRKGTLPQRWLGKKKVSLDLIKTRVPTLVRKPRSKKKQNNVETELQKELENAPTLKRRQFQLVTVDLDCLARKRWWQWRLKGAFLKAFPNTLISAVRSNQGIRRNVENDFKQQKKDAPSSRPLKWRRAAWQGMRWKLYDLTIVYKEPCKSVNSERAPTVEGKGEPEKDEIVLNVLRGRLGSLNSSANVRSAQKVQSRKLIWGHYTKIGRKGLLTLLTSMKTKPVVIQRMQGFGNKIILSVHIGMDGSRDPCRRENSTELSDIQILSRNDGQGAISSISDFSPEKLKFLFKVTSKDRKYRGKFWSVYVRVPLKLHKRKTNIFQRKIDRLVEQDGSQTGPRVPNKKPEVGPGAPELEDERKASQWIRLEKGEGKNSWNKGQPPSISLLYSQLYTFIIRSHFNNTVMSQEKLTAFIESFVAQLPRKSQSGLVKLTGRLTALKTVISLKSSSFRLESQQVNSIRNLGRMRRLILNLWKTKHPFPSILPSDLILRSKKAIESDDGNMSVTSQYQKLLHNSQSLSSDLLYSPGFAPSSELSKRQKRGVRKDDEMTQVPVGFLNHLSSLLGFGIGVIAMALIILSVVIIILFFKRRELFQISRVPVTDKKWGKKSSNTMMDSCFHCVSLSRCFHSSGLQVPRRKELELQEAFQKYKQRESGLMMTTITSDTSDSVSSEESVNLDQSFFSSSSLPSFYTQSIEVSRDWFSDEEDSVGSFLMKGDPLDRVQVYLETMDHAENVEEFQCDVTACDDQNLILEKTSRQKMQMPESVTTNPPKASSDISSPPESGADHSKASTSIPSLPQSCTNASKAASDISCRTQSSKTQKDSPFSETE